MTVLLKKYYPLLLTFLAITIFQSKHLTEFPSHIHAWAQSDHYALSLGFVDNGLNFFKPQTYVMNHQFPDKFRTPNSTSITSVDFPMHNYIPAIAMKITGIKSPFFNRFYTLLYSFLGLFFLFKIVFYLTNNNWLSTFIVIFASTSPIYTYYQSGFLPTIPSISNALIGIYYYITWLNNRKSKAYITSIIFLTLASLARTPFSIILIASFCHQFIITFRIKKIFKYQILAASVSIILISGYFLYNKHLANTYGTIFLGKPLPPKNLKQALEIIKIATNSWGFQYFSKFHYLSFFLLVVLNFRIFYLKNKLLPIQKEMIFFTTIALLGSSLYSILMLKQFKAHDYYFLDTFFIPVILICTILISQFQQKKKFLKYSILPILFFAFFFFQNSNKTQKERRKTGNWDNTQKTIDAYKNADILLDQLEISKEAKIMALYPIAPNIPFILMNRKGYAIESTSEEILKDVLSWDYDYISIANDFLMSDVINEYPDFIKHVNKIGESDKLGIYTLADTPINRSLIEFLGLNKRKPHFSTSLNFENIESGLWKNTEISNNFSFSKPYSGFVDSTKTYGITLKGNSNNYLKPNSKYILISLKLLSPKNINNTFFTFAINKNGKLLHHQAEDLNLYIKQYSVWNNAILLFEIPALDISDKELALYIWNKEKNKLFYDDLKICVY